MHDRNGTGPMLPRSALQGPVAYDIEIWRLSPAGDKKRREMIDMEACGWCDGDLPRANPRTFFLDHSFN